MNERDVVRLSLRSAWPIYGANIDRYRVPIRQTQTPPRGYPDDVQNPFRRPHRRERLLAPMAISANAAAGGQARRDQAVKMVKKHTRHKWCGITSRPSS